METYERKYKEALERAKNLHKDAIDMEENLLAKQCEIIFPELKESEDECVEKIKKDIISYLNNRQITSIAESNATERWLSWIEKYKPISFTSSEETKVKMSLMKYISELNQDVVHLHPGIKTCNEWIAWLEKQGEQKPILDFNADDWYVSKVDGKIHNTYHSVDKIEPKFKVGDWVILTAGELSITLQIVNVDINKKRYWFNDSSYLPIVDEECLHLWTIEDAKPGDVIYLPNGNNEYYFFIFKGIENAAVMSFAHFYQHNDGTSEVEGTIDNLSSVNDVFQPATKEQRDLLFAKMKEAGYEWDAEKKVLRTIEQKPVDKIEPKFHEGDWVVFNNQHGSIYQVEKIEDYEYTLRYFLGGSMSLSFSSENMIRRWTIDDAKDGDVLHSTGWHNDCIFVFKGLDNWKFDEPNGDRAVATGYCCLSVSADNMEFGIQGPDCVEVNTIKPATKIQRDLLFRKMHEAGYAFDFEKKELKKIDNEEVNGEDMKTLLRTEYEKGRADAIEKIQNPAWSEEDDAMLDTMEGWLDTLCEYLKDSSSEYIPNVESCINWLKSLKNRKI